MTIRLLLAGAVAVFSLFPDKAIAGYKLHVAEFHSRPGSGPIRARFLISDQFSAAERKTISRALDFLATEYSRHKKEFRQTGSSAYERELARSFTKDAPDSRKSDKVEIAGDTMTAMMMYVSPNVGQEVKIERYFRRDNSWGTAGLNKYIFGYRSKQDLENRIKDMKARKVFSLNSYNLAKDPDRVNNWAGTIFHEVLHQCGYHHPTGYKGSLIKEAGLVIAREARPRQTGLGLSGREEFGYMIIE